MDHWIYIINAWIHIIAAMAWIGGMLFLSIIMVPALRKLGSLENSAAMIRETGRRFRRFGYLLFIILLITGAGNLHMRGFTFKFMGTSDFWMSPYGQTLAYKLVLFILMIGLGVAHDFLIGRKALAAMVDRPASGPTLRMRRAASWMGRLNIIIAILISLLGVMLVRGRPW